MKVAPSGSADRDAYVIPILEALVEMGGKGDTDAILDRMREKMEARGLLGQEDYKDVPGGTEVRWRNTGRWCRNDLVRRGLLSSHSARGVWEITEAGRAWLQKRRRISAEPNSPDKRCHRKRAARGQ